MPLLAVEIDGRTVASVRCDDFHVVNARISGSLVEPQFATVELTTSTHPDAGDGTYLLWLNEMELQPGQTVTVKFLDAGDVHGAGKTIDELYPEGDEREPDPEKPFEECFRELRVKPNFRTSFAFLATTPTLSGQSSGTAPGEFSFSFSVLWNWLRQDRASVSLSTWTIDSVEFNTPSREHLREYINVGQEATLRVDA